MQRAICPTNQNRKGAGVYSSASFYLYRLMISRKKLLVTLAITASFTAKTGVNVAQYIRELKLSRAAESLLDSPSERVIDIALSFGFNSEISFSRSFKQFFGCSPREYRKRGIRSGLRQPITSISFSSSDVEHSPSTPSHLSFTQIRIEYKAAFSVAGYRGDQWSVFVATRFSTGGAGNLASV